MVSLAKCLHGTPTGKACVCRQERDDKMVINGKALDFLNNAIQPALQSIGLWNPAAGELLLGTAIHESGGLKFRKQLGGGPALSYFQMEPVTHNDIWDNYLKFRPELAAKVQALLSSPSADKMQELENNDKYACAMARIKYLRMPGAMPAEGDLQAQALYWKRWYNTPLGAGTPEQYMADWNRMNGSTGDGH
jgi:hypothetical protein